jgi:hypothetical protein
VLDADGAVGRTRGNQRQWSHHLQTRSGGGEDSSWSRLPPGRGPETVPFMMTTQGFTHTFLDNLRDLKLPMHLLEGMAAVPGVAHTQLLPAADGSVAVSTSVDPDFETLFESAGAEGGDPDFGRWEARNYGPAAASLLFSGAEIAYNTKLDLVGRGTFGPGLELADTSSFDVSGLRDLLPDEVYHWLSQFNQQEAAAWVAMLFAEIQMHAVFLATGEFLWSHSPASALAFEIALKSAESYFSDVLYGDYSPLDFRDRFEAMGGDEEFDDVIDYFASSEDTDFLWEFGDPETSPLAHGDVSNPIHPVNWFASYVRTANPWLPETAEAQRIRLSSFA